MKEELKQICVRWEKLRIPFNILLVVTTIACYLVAPDYLIMQTSDGIIEAKRNGAFIAILPFLSIAANSVYLLGPLFEFYLYFLGINKSVFRVLIFFAGSITGSILAGFVTLEYSHYAIQIEQF